MSIPQGLATCADHHAVGTFLVQLTHDSKASAHGIAHRHRFRLLLLQELRCSASTSPRSVRVGRWAGEQQGLTSWLNQTSTTPRAQMASRVATHQVSSRLDRRAALCSTIQNTQYMATPSPPRSPTGPKCRRDEFKISLFSA